MGGECGRRRGGHPSPNAGVAVIVKADQLGRGRTAADC